MKKPFLLMAGYNEAPESSTEEWVACYETEEAAMKEVTANDQKLMKFRDPGFKVRGTDYDWYDIIDLREWCE